MEEFKPQLDGVIKKISNLDVAKFKIMCELIEACDQLNFDQCQQIASIATQLSQAGQNIQKIKSNPTTATKVAKTDVEGPINGDKEIEKPYEEIEAQTWYQWYELCKYYRIKKDFENAFNALKKSYKNDPPEDSLFKIFEEIGISAFYLGEKRIGFEAYERFIMSQEKTVHWTWKDNAIKNQSYYMTALPLTSVSRITCKEDPNYTPSSSALIPFDKHYFLNVRTVNYSIDPNGKYIIRDPKYHVKTINRFAKVCDEQISSSDKFIAYKKVDDYSIVKKYDVNIEGMEDLRLFGARQIEKEGCSPELEVDVFVTYPQVNTSRTPQMCYGVIDGKGLVQELYPLTVTEKLQCEKNWLPFRDDNGDICFIYSFVPLKIYKISFELIPDPDVMQKKVGICEKIFEKTFEKDISTFRGSAAPVPYKGGWLMTIHQVMHNKGARRMYFHRFVWLSKDYNTIRYTLPFYFESPNIEYTLGLCKKHGEGPETYYVVYSVGDNSANIGQIEASTIDGYFEKQETGKEEFDAFLNGL